MNARSTAVAAPLQAQRQPRTAPARLAVARAARPRLLLPPLTEPEPRLPEPLPLHLAPAMRSVLSPVTEVPWPVATPVRTEAVAPPPDPTRLCGSIVLAAVEALNGTRPLAQLTRWVSPEVFESLSAALTAPAPRRPTGDDPRRPPGRATVRRTHLFRVSDTVAEASVVVHDAGRVRAAAVRVAVHRGHWRATVLQIG